MSLWLKKTHKLNMLSAEISAYEYTLVGVLDDDIKNIIYTAVVNSCGNESKILLHLLEARTDVAHEAFEILVKHQVNTMDYDDIFPLYSQIRSRQDYNRLGALWRVIFNIKVKNRVERLNIIKILLFLTIKYDSLSRVRTAVTNCGLDNYLFDLHANHRHTKLLAVTRLYDAIMPGSPLVRLNRWLARRTIRDGL